MTMLTVSQCKEYLDDSTIKELSDGEIIKIRDVLQAFAELTLEMIIKNKHRL
jgi:hypothetical protein